MTFNQSLPTANRACGRLFCAYNFVGNKKPALGGLLHTVIKAAAIALMTLNPPRDEESSNEITM